VQQFYPIVVAELSVDDGGGYVAYAPDLHGCMSDGETPEQAFENGRQAIKEWVEHALERGLEVPKPGSARANAARTRDSLLAQIREMTEPVLAY
jgi:antitoxin HicB